MQINLNDNKISIINVILLMYKEVNMMNNNDT